MSTQFTNRQWRLPNNENKDKQSNYSMDFDGSQSVDVGTVTINNSGSFSIWFKISNIAYYQNILGSSNASGMFKYITLRNGILYQYVLGTGWIVLYSTSLDDNEWHNLIFTYDSTTSGGPARGTFKSYVDGVLTKTYDMINDVSEDWSSSTLTSIAYFGTTQPFGPRYFDGKIDAVAIFNYALTDGTGGTVNQIAALYGSSSTGIGNPMSLSPKPVAYYPLGDQDAFNGSSYLTPNASLKDYVFDFIPNDYIDLGNNVFFNTNNPFSFSTWVNLDSYSDPYPYLANLKTNVTDGIGIFISNNSSYSGVNVGSTDSSITKGKTTGDISGTFLNSWNQVVVTYNGNGANTLSNFLIYVNGSPVTLTSTGTFGTMPNTANNIGRRSNSYHYLDGKMSNVQIFNTALPATGSNSIETLYNNGSPLTSMTGFTSLQGWWKLDASATYDSSTGNWTIEDYAGSNDGTSSGMTQANLVQSDLSFTSGYSPYALSFDAASSDYINFTGLPDFGGGSLTTSFWIKSGIDSSNAYVLMRSGFSFYIFQSGTASNLKYRIQTSSLNTISGGAILDNNWHHCVMTFDSTANEFKVFEDGVQVSSTVTTSGSLASSTSTVYLASFATGAPFKSGSFSNLSMWNAALTSAQVTEIYNEGVPSNLNNHSAYSNLVSWWQLGSNSSFNTNWTVLDEKGSNNGTSANMGEDAIVDGVGSYANGLSSGMGGDEVIGDAPYSSSNALSVNMDVEDRVTDTPS